MDDPLVGNPLNARSMARLHGARAIHRRRHHGGIAAAAYNVPSHGSGADRAAFPVLPMAVHVLSTGRITPMRPRPDTYKHA